MLPVAKMRSNQQAQCINWQESRFNQSFLLFSLLDTYPDGPITAVALAEDLELVFVSRVDRTNGAIVCGAHMRHIDRRFFPFVTQ